MEFLAAAGAVVVAIGSFVAGWLTATEKIRTEVYAKKLEVYLKLNALAADLFHLSIKATVDPNEYSTPMFQARLALAEYTASHSILVSKSLGPHIEKLIEARKQPDIESLRVTFNLMSNTMATELKLEKIHAVTALLHNLGRDKQGV
jgi:hypothetical protein